jgi:hypothetical protein
MTTNLESVSIHKFLKPLATAISIADMKPQSSATKAEVLPNPEAKAQMKSALLFLKRPPQEEALVVKTVRLWRVDVDHESFKDGEISNRSRREILCLITC